MDSNSRTSFAGQCHPSMQNVQAIHPTMTIVAQGHTRKDSLGFHGSGAVVLTRGLCPITVPLNPRCLVCSRVTTLPQKTLGPHRHVDVPVRGRWMGQAEHLPTVG